MHWFNIIKIKNRFNPNNQTFIILQLVSRQLTHLIQSQNVAMIYRIFQINNKKIIIPLFVNYGKKRKRKKKSKAMEIYWNINYSIKVALKVIYKGDLTIICKLIMNKLLITQLFII